MKYTCGKIYSSVLFFVSERRHCKSASIGCTTIRAGPPCEILSRYFLTPIMFVAITDCPLSKHMRNISGFIMQKTECVKK